MRLYYQPLGQMTHFPIQATRTKHLILRHVN
jgi:hypothetical protein